ncbi:helix-turn-helix domain-containing protein [Algibacter sp. L1A34]|uniref:helix-turn-helix domain-containing protein n=1 Tax=Algibacter sp. L1A34 TaxID=2686365 RepID=UPI00131C92AD
MVRKKNGRLTLKERIQIETLLNENKSKAYISKTLKRARSTITREINKWVNLIEINTLLNLLIGTLKMII